MELWQLSVQALSEGFIARTFDPVEVFDAVSLRIESQNPQLNAIIHINENARTEAIASAERYASGNTQGPLDGVPITVKDNIPVAGQPCTWGSRCFSDHIATHDESPIARLRSAGVVFIGKTNVPEFTLQGYTDNLLFGATANPWNHKLTPGGSSGGAVAAVSSGMGALAIGTDGGGSIRRPAAHTGLYGLKTSPGLIGRAYGLPALLEDFETIGPMTRRAADLRLALTALAGSDPQDRNSAIFSTLERHSPRLFNQSPKVLYIPLFGENLVDPDVLLSADTCAEALVSLGCRVEQGKVPFSLDQLDNIWNLIGPVGLATMVKRLGLDTTIMTESMQQMIAQGLSAKAIDYAEMLSQTRALRSHFAQLFDSVDFLLTPSVAALPWAKHESHPGTIADQPVGPRGHAVYTAFANAAGLPALSIPTHPASNGLPIGCQLVGRFGSDWQLIDLAERYESQTGEFQWPT